MATNDASKNSCFLRLRIAFSIIGALVGLSIFFTFGLQYENWNCAIWGLFSGVAASITLFVHIQYVRGVWEAAYPVLTTIMLCGCFTQLAGVVGISTYLAIAIRDKQELTPYGEGFYLTAVWCAMTLKWGFFLFSYSRKYRNFYVAERRKLLDPSTYDQV